MVLDFVYMQIQKTDTLILPILKQIEEDNDGPVDNNLHASVSKKPVTQVPDSDKSEDVSALLSDSNAKAAVKPVSVNDVKPFLESSFAGSSYLEVHSFYSCQEEHCTDISKTEHDRIKTKDRFQHHWIFEKKLSYCKKTGFYWLVFEEGKGMYS